MGPTKGHAFCGALMSNIRQHRKLTMPQPERTNVMTSAPHPYFGIWFRRFFFRAWFVIAALFVLSLLLLKNDFSVIGAVLAISFGISIPFTIGYLLYRLYHIDCPNCHAQLKTIKNVKMSKYEAVCNRCKIVWDVGIGIGNSD